MPDTLVRCNKHGRQTTSSSSGGSIQVMDFVRTQIRRRASTSKYDVVDDVYLLRSNRVGLDADLAIDGGA